MILLRAVWALLLGGAAAQTAMGPARFTVIAPELIRLEYQKDGRFVDEPSLFAVNRGIVSDGFTEERSSEKLVIDTGKMRLIYKPDGKPFHAGNLRALIRVEGQEDAEWKPGAWSDKDLGGARNLDNTKGVAPMEQGLLSRDGWHVVDDSEKPILKDDWVSPRPGGAGLDWYLFGYGHDYKTALKDLTAIAGAVPMPRKYVLGSWYSRWWPHSAKDYQRIVGEYDAHGFPLDVVVMDMDWHLKNDWTGYTWNKELFPDPAGFLSWVHGQGLFATLNDHLEQVQPFEEHYADFMRALGRDPAARESVPFDAGNKKQMQALFDTVYAPLERQGVDFWWLDYWSEAKERPFNHLRWVNELYYRHSRQGGLRGQIFSRWGDWGNHRQPINFSGDAFILWPTLQFQVPFTANSGNVGAFFWAHDVGGYQGKRSPELLARWTQFAALSAALRLHAMKNPRLDKRPWSYPKEIEDSMRAAFHLRSELFPYIYSGVWQAHSLSLPLMRPLYLEYPQEDAAYKNPQEYLFGDALLVAPITTPGKGKRHLARQKVWLPEGTWYAWFSGERFEGGGMFGPFERVFEADLSSFPVFARGGAPIVMQPYTPRMTTAPLKTLVVRVYPGTQGSATLYEDDGATLAYSTGAYCLTKIDYRKADGVAELSIVPGSGRFGGQVETRGYVIELPGETIVKAEVDGAAAQPRDGRIEIAARDVRARVALKVWTK